MGISGITSVPGILAGHYTDKDNKTGCTVILCPEGAVCGADVRGAAPGTRETDLLRPENTVQMVHAVLLTGGSAYGLDAAGGVMKYLEERGIGYQTPAGVVPIVPAAVLYDLDNGNPKIRPGTAEGYKACLNASDGELAQGSVGAGTGATVGKILGAQGSMPGGIGCASVELPGGVFVAAVMAVNALGDICDGESIIAGAKRDGQFIHTCRFMLTHDFNAQQGTNTTIGVVATNAWLDKAQAARLASAAHDGLARAVVPAHTVYDGDTIFALSAGELQANQVALQAAAAHVTRLAVINAVKEAKK